MQNESSNSRLQDTMPAGGRTIDLSLIGGRIWRQRWIFIGVSVATLIIAVIYLHLVPDEYTITYQVTAVSSASKGTNGNLTQLANMAGISLEANDQEAQPFDLYLQGLFTRAAADEVAKNRPLMHRLYAREWDEKSQAWHDPGSVFGSIASGTASLLGAPKHYWTPPSAVRLQDFIVKKLVVTRDLKTPVVTIQMKYSDPKLAVDFLNALNAAVDSTLRKRTLARTTTYINYLSSQFDKVTVEGYQQALIALLTEQEKRRMFASSTISYAAELFEKPVASQWPTSPNAGLTLFLAGFFGLLLGAISACLWDIRTASRPAARGGDRQ